MQNTMRFSLLKEIENLAVYIKSQQIADVNHYTNEYIVVDTKAQKCVVIDPAFDGQYIYDWIVSQKLILEGILITHGHADHVGGLNEFMKLCNTKIYITQEDQVGLLDSIYSEENKVGFVLEKLESKYVERIINVQNNDIITISDNIKFKAICTPGHTKGSVTYVLEDMAILFVGDTVFKTTYGRTDLITSSREQMRESLDLLYNNYLQFYTCPGHGEQFVLLESKRRVNLLFALGS